MPAHRLPVCRRAPHPGLPVAWLLAVLGLAGACDAGLAGATCEDDHDCEAPLACTANLCAPAAPTSLALSLRVIPRADAGLPAQQFARLDPATTQLTLAPALAVRGVMRPAEDPFTVNVPGELEFRAEGLIPGLTQRFSARSLDGVDASGDGFRADVLAGLDYRVTFVPSEGSWPRMFFDLKASELPEAPGGALAAGLLSLPEPAAMPRFTGAVVTASGEPVPLARISAFSPRGELLGATLSEAPEGTFSLPISPLFPTISVRVEPPSAGTAFPEFRIDALSVASPARLALPFDVAETAVYRASLRVTAGEGGPPVAGVPVTVVGLLDGGTVRATATTDGEGRVRLRTFAGAYECLVAVPAGAPWASWHGYVTVSPEMEPVIALGFRPQVSVSVKTHDGAFANGTVTLTRDVYLSAGGALAIAPEPLVVDLDAQGEAQVALEPGVHAARFAPAPGSSAPLAWRGGLEVGLDGAELSWLLPLPAPVALTLLHPDGSPVAEASVELWVTPAAAVGAGQTPYFLGRALTDARGGLQVRVPQAEASP